MQPERFPSQQNRRPIPVREFTIYYGEEITDGRPCPLLEYRRRQEAQRAPLARRINQYGRRPGLQWLGHGSELRRSAA